MKSWWTPAAKSRTTDGVDAAFTVIAILGSSFIIIMLAYLGSRL